MSTSTKFPERLKIALEGYDKRDICYNLGKTDRSLRSWLAGENLPMAGVIADLCRLLEVSADWLLGLTDDKPERFT